MARSLLLLASLLALAGCASMDPYRRAGMWQPTGANDRNLAAMAADTRDLARGRAAPAASRNEAASAVERLLQGNPKPLHTVNSQTAPAASAGGR